MSFAEQLIRSVTCRRLGLIGCLLLPIAAPAQVLINPVIVELGSRQKAATVTVSLGSKAQGAVRLQTQVLSWKQDVDGTSRYAPTSDLIVAPPIAELKPGESQLFRVALRGQRSSPGELAYRLVFEDVAQPAADPTRAVSFRLRYDLPLLVAPSEPARDVLRWQACPAKPAEACVRLSNEGNRRITFATLNVEGPGWTLSVNTPGTVLAGGQREWRVPLPSGQAGAAQRVTGSTRAGQPIEARLSP